MKKVLIAIGCFSNLVGESVDELKNLNVEIIPNKSGRDLDYKIDKELYSECDYIIAGLEPYPAEFFDEFKNVRAISRIGVGVDSIDLASAEEHNVKIFVTSDKPSVAVAELCVSNMIALLRHTFVMNAELKNGIWNPIQGRNIRSCKVGIVGLGSIGKEVVKRLEPFGPQILAYARTWDETFASQYQVTKKTLVEIFEESDIVTIHLPLTKETKGLISKELISKMKEKSFLLNTSRSGVLDNQALSIALSDDKVQGAAIDVFDEEKNIHPYDELSNVILTPHVGSHTYETRKAMEEMSVKNLAVFAALEQRANGHDFNELLSYIEKHSVV